MAIGGQVFRSYFMKIHFIGIGGIGVSALAKYYQSRGFEVSGSDLVGSEITETLQKQGVKIFIGRHKDSNVPKNLSLVIYSAAVEKSNPELIEAKRRGIKSQTYAEALGELTKKYFTIAISGMHGKSTATAMIALILVEAGFDPTVIVGTKLREFGNSNFRFGKSKYLVIEADEYSASFLNYWPKIIVLTNIEEDHLDYYRDLGHILETFKEYIGHLPEDGILVANGDDKNIQTLLNPKSEIRNPKQISRYARSGVARQNSKFSIQNYSNPFVRSDERTNQDNSKFKIKWLNLKIPGRHNLMNAYAAMTVARALNIPDQTIIKALNNFQGTWRRFEYKGKVNGAKIFDDYGHHPTEIEATLQAARGLLPSAKRQALGAKPKLWCVFQPHQYQRTFKLFDQFVNAFDEADKVILLPIYSVAGREKESIKKKVSSKKLAEAINIYQKPKTKNQKHKPKIKNNKIEKVIYSESFEKAADYLKKNLKRDDMAIIMGAGDIYLLTQKLIQK